MYQINFINNKVVEAGPGACASPPLSLLDPPLGLKFQTPELFQFKIQSSVFAPLMRVTQSELVVESFFFRIDEAQVKQKGTTIHMFFVLNL